MEEKLASQASFKTTHLDILMLDFLKKFCCLNLYEGKDKKVIKKNECNIFLNK